MPTLLQRLKGVLKYNPLKGVSKKASNIMHSVLPSKRKRSTIRKSGGPASKRAKVNFPPANVPAPAPAPAAPAPAPVPAPAPAPAPVPAAVGGRKMRMKNLRKMMFYKARNNVGKSRKGSRKASRKASRKGRKASRKSRR